MDHDDNDFQSQNFHLVGEDTNKFPSSLRLFSLPKFELDDHLQIHLRFDGLTEQEPLLGIQDQEQNNWIENFSPDKTALELSSGAAESCSISMQKNVWSEATSSESVEMLLKSVGEDDIMNKRMNVIYSESHNGLIHMNPCCSQDDSFQSEDKSMVTDPVALPGKCEKALSGLKKDSAISSEVPDMSDTSNDEESGRRNFEVLGEVSKGETVNNPKKVIAEKCGLNDSLISPMVESFAAKEKLFDNSCCETTNLNDEFVKMNESNDQAAAAHFVAEESRDASRVQIDPIVSSVSILAKDSDGSPTQTFDENVSESYSEEVFYVNSQNLEGSDHNIGSPTLTRDSGLEMRPYERHTVENIPDSPVNSSILEQKAESSALSIEGHSEHVASEKDGLSDNAAYRINVVTGCNRASGQISTIAYEKSLPVTENQTNVDGHSIEISNMDNIQSTFVDSLECSREVSSIASVESKVSLKDNDIDENLMSVKNREVAGHCEGRQLEEPAIPTVGKKDACNHSDENKKLVELCTLSHTNFGREESDKKEDNKLAIDPPELTFQSQQSLEVQKNTGGEVLEHDERVLVDTISGPREIVQEVVHSPSQCVKHSENTQISPSQDVRSLEKHVATVEPVARNSDVLSTPLLPIELCSLSPANLEKINNTDMEKLHDTLAESQTESTCILAAHMEGLSAGVTTQVEPGDAVNFKKTTLQSVGLPKSSSEPCSLEDGGCEPNSFEPSCGSPIVVSCIEPPPDELHQEEPRKGLSDPGVPLSGSLPQVSSFNRSSKEINYTDCDTKESNASEENRSFTFEVGSLPDTALREAADQCKLFSSTQSYDLLQGGESCLTTSGLRKADDKVLKATGVVHPPAEVANKSTRKDKSKTVSCSVTDRLTASKRKSVNELLLVEQSDERDGNPCSTPVNKIGTMSGSMQLEMQQHSYSEGGSVRPSCASSVQASNLPDSNTAVALFHQPFTDKQQVQLRAQIFVYGSLIQGVPPDEACMISAFGNTDGGRNAWEGVWRIAAERFHSQRSPTTSCVTHSNSHSGVSVHEQISTSSPLQGKTHGILVSQASKGAPPVIISSSMSLPSSLWCVSTPRDVLQSNVSKNSFLASSEIFSSLHVSHSSHGKQNAGNGKPWLSQASPASPVPLVASSQTPILDAGAHFSKLPLAETLEVTNSSVPFSSNLQLKMPSSFTTAPAPLTPPAATTVQFKLMKKTESSGTKNQSANQKPRRKKSVVSEMPAQLLPHSQHHTELDSTTAAMKHPPAAITSTTVSPVVLSTESPVIGSHRNEQNATILEETCSKTVQVKLQAEDAAAVAAAAVRHSEGIWNQLSAQKNSGLVSEMEMKLAYAAVAAAAAFSVAKAAAAAAKVAGNAALQAKMMADAALSSKKGNTTQHSETIHIGGVTHLTGLAPILFLKGKDETRSSSSLIAAAKETARRRVEAASAAAKHAENLDTIVKAAELTAVAISQAGAIIAMGEPLPFALNDLIEAGPEGYRKVQHSCAGTRKEKQMDLDCADGLNTSLPHLPGASLNEKHTNEVTDEGGKSSYADELKQSVKNQPGSVTVLPFNISAPESEKNDRVSNVKENNILEGSLVEVLSDDNGLRRVWYSAKVLSLKDGKAYVCYNEHPNAGSHKLKEWIPLDGESDKPPRIRIAHPTTAVKYEGTRKRRRAAIGNYVWEVGDRVDAWIHDGWCEGIVTEKSEEDETKLTIHFPAGGDTSVLTVWQLRPSLIWKDSQWVEWSRPRENILHPQEVDTPQDKRQKLIRIDAEKDGTVTNIDVGKHSSNVQIGNSRKPEESRPLLLSEKDQMFSLGKSVREESNSDTLTIKRTGLQKEGSRVIFGIPKPGKKRKFMEVSKHYVKKKSDHTSEGSTSIEVAKYLVPQSSLGWKNTKAVLKGRQDGELKPKVVRSIKSQSVQTRSAAEGEDLFPSTELTSNGVATGSHEQDSEKNLLEAVSSSNHFEAEENRSESYQCPVPRITLPEKKMTSAVGSDVDTIGEVAPSLEKANNEDNHSYLADPSGKTVPDSVEPRRSSRRIQPTSRLLEGLQSSTVAAKVPGLPHEKSARASHQNGSTSGGNMHG